MIKSFGLTDVGVLRHENEDAFLLYPEKNIFVVADGVGGQNKGQLASKLATDEIKKYIDKNKDIHNLEEYFLKLLNKIDKKIMDQSLLKVENKGMATTLISCYMENNNFFIVNIGDSRGYLITDDDMIKITDDHSYVNELLKAGEITEDEARVHPKKNIITKALGIGENVNPDFYKGELKKNDMILLCSDGLTNEVEDAEIFKIVKEKTNLKTACISLVKKAKKNGGKDNITLVLIKEE
ncbi:MAG: Stp1/IreP family PP2C-type Ser/Thr phosphatase [Clostridiales Family XIII bacterium]|nr:Stp1/IreP family PP2C-type Ser/Thr phosphatase [Clostridiales Family XIII bacterium]